MTRQRPIPPHSDPTEHLADGTGDAGTGVLADPGRVQQIDPRTLLLDTNIRHDPLIDRALLASIRDHGVLEPIQAVVTDDGHARVRFGHRRTLAAIAADRVSVPVVVHAADDSDPTADDARRLATQYAENTHRIGLSTAEQLDVFAGLADLGLSAGQIAGRTKARRLDVVAALRAARSSAARDAVAAADLTLTQGAVLAEFADDPDAYQALLDRATNTGRWGGSFEHLAQRLRDQRADRAALARAIAEFTAAGVPVLDEPWDLTSAVVRLSDLTDDPEAPPDAAAPPAPGAEPQHDPRIEGPALPESRPEVQTGGVVIDLDRARAQTPVDGGGTATWDDDPQIDEPAVADGEYDGELLPRGDVEDASGDDSRDETIFRRGDDGGPAPISPVAHTRCPGHAVHVSPTHGPDRVEAAFVCTDPARYGHRPRHDYLRLLEKDTENGTGEHTGTGNRGAQRRRVIAGNRAWRSAESVRREFVATIAARRTPPKGAGAYLAATVSSDWHALGANALKGHDLAADLLTGRPSEPGEIARDRIAARSDGATDARGHVIALAVVLGGIEAGLGVHSWRPDPFPAAHQAFVRYVRFLVSIGYEPAPIERYALGDDVADADVFGPPAARDLNTSVAETVEDPDPTK